MIVFLRGGDLEDRFLCWSLLRCTRQNTLTFGLFFICHPQGLNRGIKTCVGIGVYYIRLRYFYPCARMKIVFIRRQLHFYLLYISIIMVITVLCIVLKIWIYIIKMWVIIILYNMSFGQQILINVYNILFEQGHCRSYDFGDLRSPIRKLWLTLLNLKRIKKIA